MFGGDLLRESLFFFDSNADGSNFGAREQGADASSIAEGESGTDINYFVG